ncbi:hypothetical protein BDZ89DRAFT_225940 [Hymenopellis radicata]|nr:hypothetical protein BDZ89DRAFT_225940 [Hymenopellis radicata]
MRQERGDAPEKMTRLKTRPRGDAPQRSRRGAVREEALTKTTPTKTSPRGCLSRRRHPRSHTRRATPEEHPRRDAPRTTEERRLPRRRLPRRYHHDDAPTHPRGDVPGKVTPASQRRVHEDVALAERRRAREATSSVGGQGV